MVSDKKHLSVVPGDPSAPPFKPPKITRDLSKLSNVAKEIVRIYRDMRHQRITSQEGTRATYVLRQLADVLELAEIERRLEAIEKRLNPSG